MKGKIFRLALLINLLFILVAVGWIGYRLVFKLAGRLPETTKAKLLQVQFDLKAGINDVVDLFYLKTHLQTFRIKDLDSFDLILSDNDLNKIAEDVNTSMILGYHDEGSSNKQQISLFYNQKEIPYRVSFHGGGANNYIFDKTDYDIELRKDNLIDGASGFTLFI